MEMRAKTSLSKGSVGFWGSGEGIDMRLGMLSSSINTGSYNNALQVLAPAYGVQYFKMSGRNQNANTASGIMGAFIGKGCSCPSSTHTQIAITSGIFGFHGKKNQSSSNMKFSNG
jgi:hypothetical protein